MMQYSQTLKAKIADAVVWFGNWKPTPYLIILQLIIGLVIQKP